MDRHAAIRWHAGLRIAAIRWLAGLRIAGAQDHEEPALRYQVETQLVDVIRGSDPKCWTCVPAVWRSMFLPRGQVQGVVQRWRRGAAAAWRACYGIQGRECWDMVKVSTVMGNDRYNGGLVHTEPRATDVGTCARLCVLRVWCLLSGQICYTKFCPGTFLNNTTVGSPISKQCCYALSKLQNLRPSHEERIVGTLASTPLVLGPLPVGAGPHQAEAAWAPPTPHRLRPAGVPWERRRGWWCANSAVKRRALRGSVT